MNPEIFHGSEQVPADLRPVLTIGNFDGVHLGHQRLLARLVERARELDAPACVYTFDPPPRIVLQPDRAPPRILGVEQKVELLGQAGVTHVVLEPFTAELGARSPAWFADHILLERLNPRAMVVGYDFRYGRARAGTIDTLRAHAPELPIEAVEALTEHQRIVSSSRIREAVAEGRIRDAAEMLGRPFSLRGNVVTGSQKGRQMGFPTANLDAHPELLPALGVYAVRAGLVGEELVPAVANLGTRPTFDGQGLRVEVHLLEGGGNLYGQRMHVDFIARIRAERRFSGMDALAAQIQADVARARELLANT